MKRSDDERSVMTAVTFAEAGEWEAARRYAPARGGRSRLWEWIERHLVAAALAEEGLRDEALRASGVEPPRSEEAVDVQLAAHGIRMFSGILSPAALSARR